MSSPRQAHRQCRSEAVRLLAAAGQCSSLAAQACRPVQGASNDAKGTIGTRRKSGCGWAGRRGRRTGFTSAPAAPGAAAAILGSVLLVGFLVAFRWFSSVFLFISLRCYNATVKRAHFPPLPFSSPFSSFLSSWKSSLEERWK